jgi:hypothetical protein
LVHGPYRDVEGVSKLVAPEVALDDIRDDLLLNTELLLPERTRTTPALIFISIKNRNTVPKIRRNVIWGDQDVELWALRSTALTSNSLAPRPKWG